MLIVMQDVDPWPFVISRIRLRAALVCQQNAGTDGVGPIIYILPRSLACMLSLAQVTRQPSSLIGG